MNMKSLKGPPTATLSTDMCANHAEPVNGFAVLRVAIEVASARAKTLDHTEKGLGFVLVLVLGVVVVAAAVVVLARAKSVDNAEKKLEFVLVLVAAVVVAGLTAVVAVVPCGLYRLFTDALTLAAS